jgi:cytochrome P450
MTRSLADYNYLDPDTLSDPYDFYALARKERPVFKVSQPGGKRDIYLVLTYDLIQEVNGNPELFSSSYKEFMFEGASVNPEADAIIAKGWPAAAAGLLLTSDDPDHRRWRSLVNTVFTPKRIAQMADGIERIIDELIDGFITRGECNFVEEFAIRLPTYVVADILGLDRSMYDKVTIWSDAVLMRVGQMATHQQEIDAAHLIVELHHVLMNTIRQRRIHPGADLISNLIEARAEGYEPLNDVELLSLLLEIVIAGNETTRNTLMSGMARLLTERDQLQILLDEPEWIPNAIEEILRLETPATSLWRVAARDTVLGGVEIPAGAILSMRYDSASSDETQFPNPRQFDVKRKNAKRHFAFGYGMHNCLGAVLARKELNLAFPRLLERLRNPHIIEAKTDLSHRPSLLHHGIRALSISFDPAPKLLQEAA